MRKNNKANFVFFDETDIGCQEKKTQNIPLNEDDLEQIAKEEYTVGLLKTFISLKKKMSIDKFWEILEPKLKYIKNKPSWLRSEKWEGKMTVSLNKQYYLDLCQYYINAKYDSEFIYFPNKAVKESRKLEEIVINDNFLYPLYLKDSMDEGNCLNVFERIFFIRHTMLMSVQRSCEYFSKLDNVSKDDTYYSHNKEDSLPLIRSYMMSVESIFDRSFAHLDEIILLATVFSRQDIIYEMETRYNEFKRILAKGFDKLSDYIIKKQNMISNYDVDYKRSMKTVKKLEHFHNGLSWYGTPKELHKHDEAKDKSALLMYQIPQLKSELEILIKTKAYLQNRINYEKDN